MMALCHNRRGLTVMKLCLKDDSGLSDSTIDQRYVTCLSRRTLKCGGLAQLGPKSRPPQGGPVTAWVTSLSVRLGSTPSLTCSQIAQVSMSEGLKKGVEVLALAYQVFELDEVCDQAGRREMVISDDKVLEHLESLQQVLVPPLQRLGLIQGSEVSLNAEASPSVWFAICK